MEELVASEETTPLSRGRPLSPSPAIASPETNTSDIKLTTAS